MENREAGVYTPAVKITTALCNFFGCSGGLNICMLRRHRAHFGHLERSILFSLTYFQYVCHMAVYSTNPGLFLLEFESSYKYLTKQETSILRGKFMAVSCA